MEADDIADALASPGEAGAIARETLVRAAMNRPFFIRPSQEPAGFFDQTLL